MTAPRECKKDIGGLSTLVNSLGADVRPNGNMYIDTEYHTKETSKTFDVLEPPNMLDKHYQNP